MGSVPLKRAQLGLIQAALLTSGVTERGDMWRDVSKWSKTAQLARGLERSNPVRTNPSDPVWVSLGQNRATTPLFGAWGGGALLNPEGENLLAATRCSHGPVFVSGQVDL